MCSTGDHDAWLHTGVTVLPPFAGLFRLRSARRYDLLANLEDAIGLPRRAENPTVEHYLASLYDAVVEDHEDGAPFPSGRRCNHLAAVALGDVEDHELPAVVAAFGWTRNLPVRRRRAGYQDELRHLMAIRLGQRLQRALRGERHRKAA
jgi:hypothetical protein